jgi:hypothetical protein
MIADALARRFSGDQEPAVPIGLASLAGWAFAGSDLAPIGNRLVERVMANAQDAAALMDLSTILQLVGDRRRSRCSVSFGGRPRWSRRTAFGFWPSWRPAIS